MKTKNDIQKELVLLKKQNVKLHKENSDLSDKVKQLDEDTDDGIIMLRNAHERERKLNRELEELKNADTKSEANLSSLKKENQELINKFKFIKEKFESSLKVNQEILDSKEAENTSIRCDISVWKEKYEKECIDHKEARDKF